MSKIRTALVSALTIASVLAGGVAMASHTTPRPAHHVAGGVACCEDGARI